MLFCLLLVKDFGKAFVVVGTRDRRVSFYWSTKFCRSSVPLVESRPSVNYFRDVSRSSFEPGQRRVGPVDWGSFAGSVIPASRLFVFYTSDSIF